MSYQSRLLQTLDQQIRQCSDRAERARLICRRAMHLARLNHLDAATAEIGALRAELGPAMDPESGAWVLLAEGVLSYFKLDLAQSFDRLRRSYGIGKSADISSVRGVSSSWLALVAFTKGDYVASSDYVLESLVQSDVQDHAARCRAATVVSLFYGYSDQLALARTWGNKARLHATAEGDESSIAALLFNSTTFRINEARLAHAFGLPTPSDFDSLLLEINSSLNFDALALGAGLPTGPGTLRGHALVVAGRFEEAVPLLELALSEGTFPFNRAAVEADLAYCHAAMNHTDLTARFTADARASVQIAHDIDDRAFVYQRLASLAVADTSESSELHALASECLRNFRELQLSIRELCTKFPSPTTA